jgi:hypothetical protein
VQQNQGIWGTEVPQRGTGILLKLPIAHLNGFCKFVLHIPQFLLHTLCCKTRYFRPCDKHIANIVHIASSRAFLILKSFVTRDQQILVKAFTTYVRPLLEYCTPVWSPHFKKLIHMVENVQRRFTKRIDGLTHLTYPVRLQLLQLEALQERRHKFDLIMCYKILYNYVEVDANDFFCLHSDNRTRGHNLRLVKPVCNLDVCKYSFSSRVVDLWNSLPQHVVNLSTVGSFKSALNDLDFTALCDF